MPRRSFVMLLSGAVLLVGATIALRIASRLLGLMIEDDAFAFVRYAYRLLHEGSLSWNPRGPACYGLTSLLFLAVVAPLHALLPQQPAAVCVLSSFTAGLAFLAVLAFWVVRPALRAGAGGRLVVLYLLVACLPGTGSLSAHFVTGMDTTFAMLFVSVLVHLAMRFETSPAGRRSVALGVAGGVAYCARPDLMLFALGTETALAVLAPSRQARAGAARALAISCALAGVLAVTAWAGLGSPAPLAFWAKSLVRYGPGMEEAYRSAPGLELSLYLRSTLLLCIPVAGTALRDAAGRRWSFGPVETGLLAATAAYILYYRFFVLPVMGSYQRFYYPTLPALVFLGARTAATCLRLRAPAGGTGRPESPHLPGAVPGRTLRLGLATAAGLALVLLLLPAWRVTHAALAGGRPFFALHALDNHAGSGRDTWFELARFSRLPDDLVLATTEIGLPAALNPEKVIVDLSGLNEAEFARRGFDAERLFGTYRPDLIYMPHPDYREMNQQILAHPGFRAEYEYVPARLLGTRLGLAIRRSSKYFGEMRAILYTR